MGRFVGVLLEQLLEHPVLCSFEGDGSSVLNLQDVLKFTAYHFLASLNILMDLHAA